MRGFANLFLIAFAVDALLSLADVAMRALIGMPLLTGLRNSIAWFVVGAAPVLIVCLAASPRLPVRVLLLPALAAVWFATGALPIQLLVEPRLFDATQVAVQVGIAVFAFCQIRISWRRWLLPLHCEAAAFSLARFAGFGAIGVITALVAAPVYFALYLAAYLERATDGFMDFDLRGIQIAERHYVLDETEVWLVGMMHIGEQSTYDALFGSFSAESTLVLEEGLTDETGQMGEHLSYSGFATAIGLEAQDSVARFFEDTPNRAVADWPHVRHADVDASRFSPVTIAFLDRVAAVWSEDDLIPALLDLMTDSISLEDLAQIEHDIIWMRNEAVLIQLEAALDDYRRIIVPWGALHLPGIAFELEELGFTLIQTEQRRFVSWAGLNRGGL